jgi:hypothetical protein
MADITPTPPTNALPSQLTATNPLPLVTALPVQLIEVPDILLTTQQQTTLTGVLQVVNDNQLAINTSLGQILFSLPQLRTNPQLLLQLLPFIENGKPAQLHIATAPDGVLHGNLSLAAVAPTPPIATQPPPTPASLIGKNIAAVVLQENPPPQPVATPTLPPITPTTADAISALPKIAQQFLNVLTGPQPTHTPTSPAVPTAYTPPLIPGQNINVAILKIIPPGQPLPDFAPGEFAATITSFNTAFQQPVADIGNATLMLKTNLNLPIGSTLILKFPDKTPTGLLEPHEVGTKSWPALQEILAHARDATPLPLQNFLQTRIAQMNQALGGAMLCMLSTFNRGDAKLWLGQDAVEALQSAGMSNAITLLQDELSDSVTTAHDPVVGQWRVYHLPWQAQEQLAQMQVYVHHDGGGTATPEEKSSRKTRFVIDITFTKLGTMQFDGFVQKKQFDLMLRSEQTLDATLRHELRTAFNEAVGAVGYTGQLLFQQGSQGWMRFRQQRQDVMQA